jgi:hypothetical protein
MINDKLDGWLRCPSCGFCKKELNSMITLQEMMGNNDYDSLSDELKKNAEETLRRVNLFRAEYGVPMIVTSGYRTPEHNIAIGGSKNSAHCQCQAIDFKDNDGKIKEFIAKDLQVLERCDLYMEDPSVTKTWVHLSIRPTKSGNRVFMP